MRLDEWQKYIESQFLAEPPAPPEPPQVESAKAVPVAPAPLAVPNPPLKQESKAAQSAREVWSMWERESAATPEEEPSNLLPAEPTETSDMQAKQETPAPVRAMPTAPTTSPLPQLPRQVTGTGAPASSEPSTPLPAQERKPLPIVPPAVSPRVAFDTSAKGVPLAPPSTSYKPDAATPMPSATGAPTPLAPSARDSSPAEPTSPNSVHSFSFPADTAEPSDGVTREASPEQNSGEKVIPETEAKAPRDGIGRTQRRERPTAPQASFPGLSTAPLRSRERTPPPASEAISSRTPSSNPVSFGPLPDADEDIPSFSRYLPPTRTVWRDRQASSQEASQTDGQSENKSEPQETKSHPSVTPIPGFVTASPAEVLPATNHPEEVASAAANTQTADTQSVPAPGEETEPTTTSRRIPKTRARHARNVRPENVPSGLSAAELWAEVPRHVQTLLALERLEEQEVAQYSYKRPFSEKRHELIERLLDPILSLEDTARLLNVCPTTVRRYTNKGILTHYRKEPERAAGQVAPAGDKETRQRRFRLSDILAFLEAQQASLQADQRKDARALERQEELERAHQQFCDDVLTTPPAFGDAAVSSNEAG